jgi:hypothetical protein
MSTQQDATDRLPALQADLADATDDLADARQAFATAVAADPVWSAYADLLDAARTHATARIELSATTHESRGRQPSAPAVPPLSLLAELERALEAGA